MPSGTPKPAKLERTTFKTSREMDFFREKELVTQTGHPRDEWAGVFLKEVVDNALDACEQADVAPVIKVTANACGITVADNGPGIPDDTLVGAMDFTVRASNREAYVAPDRGAQGNALMTLLSMPRILDEEHGNLIVTTRGVRHEITCSADPITQRAIIHDEGVDVDEECGTTIRMQWSSRTNDGGEVLWPFGDFAYPLDECSIGGTTIRDTCLRLLRGSAVFNPHLDLSVDWFGDRTKFEVTDPEWQKWKPNKPTSPHWYEPRHFERLIGAYVTHDIDHGIDRTVSEFVSEFDGLAGSRKRSQVLEKSGLKRTALSDLVTPDGLDHQKVDRLLSAMKAATREVQPKRLGVIGEEHLKQRLLNLGCVDESIQYKKVARVDDGLPFVLESAFGWLGDDAPNRRHIFTGANWSAAIKNPFRSFGQTGQGLDSLLSELKVGAHEPVVHVLHLAHPRVEYTDRGKSALVVTAGKDI